MFSFSIRRRSFIDGFAAAFALVIALGSIEAQYAYEQIRSFGLDPQSGFYPEAAPLEGLDGRLYGTTAGGGAANAGTVYRVGKDGAGFEVLRSFGGADGFGPFGRLVQDASGFLYGTTGAGGSDDNGVVYKIRPEGAAFEVLRAFDPTGSEGRRPTGSCLLASDGFLYGTTYEAGAYGGGTLFKVSTDGQDFTILHDFGDSAGDGVNPRGVLLEASDGLLYGTTEKGGASEEGTVFVLSKFGFSYQVLKRFSAAEGQGAIAGLIQGRDGRLYGTLAHGGSQGGGVVYSLKTDGTGFNVVKAFSPSEGWGLEAPLTEASDGTLLGVATFGASTNSLGGVYRLRKDGTGFVNLRVFTSETDDLRNGTTPVTVASDSRLYFTTSVGGLSGVGGLATMSLEGNGFSILKNFSRVGTAATYPRGDIVQADDGFLLGTTERGGGSDVGTLFRVKPDGSDYSIVRSFGETGADARNPLAGLIQATDGLLYGTGRYGGSQGLGAVFRVAKDGKGYQVLHSFTGSPGGGEEPYAGVIEANDGFLYGVTVAGGTADEGVVFSLRKDGSDYRTLHSFTGVGGDGASPAWSLVQASDGVLYGVTYGGGTDSAGTVFRINPGGLGYGVLRAFSGDPQTPVNPWGGLIEGSDGRLYGTSYNGGGGGGTVFSLLKNGTDLRVLVSLPTSAKGGKNPVTSLIQDSTGRLWGTCTRGGDLDFGAVFRLNKDGSGYETVHSMAGSRSDGNRPSGRLLQLANGVLYGTTILGGLADSGSVFRISPSTVRVMITSLSSERPGVATATVKAPPGWTCHLEQTGALGTSKWTEVASGKADAAGVAVLSDSFGLGQKVRFYRAWAAPS